MKIDEKFWESFIYARKTIINDDLRQFIGSDIPANELEDALEAYASAIKAAASEAMPSDEEIKRRRIMRRAVVFTAMTYYYGRVMADKRALCEHMDSYGERREEAALNVLKHLAECQRTIVDYLAECQIEDKRKTMIDVFGADFNDPETLKDFELTAKVIRGEF